MENFLRETKEILEVDAVHLDDELNSFDIWDSLTILSIIALCDAEYNISLTADEINDSKTIKGLKELIESRQ